MATDTATDAVGDAVAELDLMTSPELADATSVCQRLAEAGTTLAADCDALGTACGRFADDVQEQRDRVDHLVKEFCGVAGIEPEDLWATNAGRIEHREALFAAIREATQRFARDELLAKLEAVGVPVGPINTVEQALNDPQVQARGMVVKGERLDGLRTPIRFSDADLALGRPAPRLGEAQPD